MEATCVSIRNPLSYLVCYGVKDVENKTWQTEYRGTLHVFSSGRMNIRGMPDFSRYPMPVIQEFDEDMAEIQQLEERGKYIGFPEHGVQVYLKNEGRQPQRIINEYNLLSDVYTHYRRSPETPFFYSNALIGTVELVDIVEDSQSEWAEEGRYHWILRNPKLFTQPVLRVKEGSGLWTYTMS
jgi:hypothetical protein